MRRARGGFGGGGAGTRAEGSERSPPRSIALTALLSTALAGCGGSLRDVPISASELPPGPTGSERPSVAAAPVAPVAAPVDEGPSVLTRAVIDRAVVRGIGAFLTRVEVRPVLDGGRFVGWRLVRGADLRRWQTAGLDLHEGDVVTRVNGQRVERPEEADAAMRSLQRSPAITLDVLREGQSVTLRVAVQEGPVASAAPPVTAPR